MSAVIQPHPRPIIPVILVKVDPMLLSPCVPSVDFLRNTFFPCFFFLYFIFFMSDVILLFLNIWFALQWFLLLYACVPMQHLSLSASDI